MAGSQGSRTLRQLHITATIRKQKGTINVVLNSYLQFIQFRIPCVGNGPTQVIKKIAPRHPQSPISQVMLESVKLTILTITTAHSFPPFGGGRGAMLGIEPVASHMLGTIHF